MMGELVYIMMEALSLFELDDVVVIVCKKIMGTDGVYNNIHIGKNLKYENDVCRMPIKK